MRFAICNETFRDDDFSGTCAKAAAHGYSGLEIAPFTLGDPVALTAARARELAATVRGHALEVVGLHWLLARTAGFHLTTADPAVRNRTFDYARHLADRCHDLGGSVMVWGSPDQRTVPSGESLPAALDRTIEFFQALAPHLEAADVIVAFEFLGPAETNFINTAADAIAMIEQIGSPQVRLHLDVKAMASDSREIPEIVQSSLPWTAHFHANDPNLRGPGMGEVDFTPIAAALTEGGYQGWVSVEVFDSVLTPDDLAAISIRNLREAFAMT